MLIADRGVWLTVQEEMEFVEGYDDLEEGDEEGYSDESDEGAGVPARPSLCFPAVPSDRVPHRDVTTKCCILSCLCRSQPGHAESAKTVANKTGHR